MHGAVQLVQCPVVLTRTDAKKCCEMQGSCRGVGVFVLFTCLPGTLTTWLHTRTMCGGCIDAAVLYVRQQASAAVADEMWDRKPQLLAAAEATGIHCGGKITEEDRIAVLMGVSSKQFTVEEAAKIVELLSSAGGGGCSRSKAGAKQLKVISATNRKQFLKAISVVPFVKKTKKKQANPCYQESAQGH